MKGGDLKNMALKYAMQNPQVFEKALSVAQRNPGMMQSIGMKALDLAYKPNLQNKAKKLAGMVKDKGQEGAKSLTVRALNLASSPLAQTLKNKTKGFLQDPQTRKILGATTLARNPLVSAALETIQPNNNVPNTIPKSKLPNYENILKYYLMQRFLKQQPAQQIPTGGKRKTRKQKRKQRKTRKH
jgi:hypothetical protein